MQGRAEPARVGEAGTAEPLGVERPVFRGEQGAAAVRGRARPALAHLVGLEPVAAQSRLPLAGPALLQPGAPAAVARAARDAGAPEPQRDAPGLAHAGG